MLSTPIPINKRNRKELCQVRNIFISLHLQSVNKISASSHYISITQYCIFEPELQAGGIWTIQWDRPSKTKETQSCPRIILKVNIVKSLIKYPVKLNTKYSLALRMLCIDLLDPLGLKSTPLVIWRLNVIINSALKSTKATLHSHHSAIYSFLHGH